VSNNPPCFLLGMDINMVGQSLAWESQKIFNVPSAAVGPQDLLASGLEPAEISSRRKGLSGMPVQDERSASVCGAGARAGRAAAR
jgi:hypothetical protein